MANETMGGLFDEIIEPTKTDETDAVKTEEVAETEETDETEEVEAETEKEEPKEVERKPLPKPTMKPTELKEKGKSFKKDEPESTQEMMLRLLLTEQNPELLEKALAEGKTIRGAMNYVTSVVKNAYIEFRGRVNGSSCLGPDAVLGIVEKYLRDCEEGTVEPETKYVPKKVKAETTPKKTDAKKVVEKVAKKASKDAKAQMDLFGDLFAK